MSPSHPTSSISRDSRPTTTQRPDPQADQDADTARSDHHRTRLEGFRDEVGELPQELSGAAEAVIEDIEATALGRWAIRTYVWVMDKAPESTRGRIIFALCVFLVVLAPSVALLYVSLDAGQAATESWFRDFGYFGIFLANLTSTATLFVPVPALTAAAQALIVSSASSLSPFGVGVAGGLGMAFGEITAYVGGMAAAIIAREEEIKAPGRFQPLIESVTRRVARLMDRFGMITLYLLSAIPNVFFEVAGLTAGATRYSFPRFMAAVIAGKVTRGLFLAYIGEKLIFG